MGFGFDPPNQEPPASARMRFGTSSFSAADWVGPFYPAGTKPGRFLGYYATQFDCVEVDATYYAIPTPRTVDGWVASTPEHFVLAAKFPRSIVHGGETAKPDVGRTLEPEATHAERDLFLDVMARLGKRCGPLVLQFPHFAARDFAPRFLERLDRFLGHLPAPFRYAVEVRNREWLAKPLLDVLRNHRAALVLADQARMPHADEIDFDPVTTDFVYVRLLGDRQLIEAVTKTWEREVIDRGERLARWAQVLAKLEARGLSGFVFVNNHYAGHAPATLRRLQALFDRARGREQLP